MITGKNILKGRKFNMEVPRGVFHGELSITISIRPSYVYMVHKVRIEFNKTSRKVWELYFRLHIEYSKIHKAD